MQRVQNLIRLLVFAAIAALCLPLFDMIYFYPSATGLLTEKAREDALHLGLFLAEGKHDGQAYQFDDLSLTTMADSFALVRATLRTPQGQLISSSSAQAESQRPFSTLSLLTQGKAFSRMFIATLPGRDEPVSLVEIQVPLRQNGRLEKVLVLTQDISSVRAALERVISRSTLFLFSVATIFLVIIVLIARMALRAVSLQGHSEKQLVESRQQLEKKHGELEELFAMVEQAKYEWQVALDCISDMILLTDETGRVKRCNEAFIRFMGRSYLDVLGKDWQRILLQNDSEMIALTQRNCQIYHQQSQVWLQLEFYPYADEQQKKLMLIRIQRQAGDGSK